MVGGNTCRIAPVPPHATSSAAEKSFAHRIPLWLAREVGATVGMPRLRGLPRSCKTPLKRGTPTRTARSSSGRRRSPSRTDRSKLRLPCSVPFHRQHFVAVGADEADAQFGVGQD